MTCPRMAFSRIARFPRQHCDAGFVALVVTTLALLTALTAIANAQTFTILYNFDGTHGASPRGPLAQGRDGSLYGATTTGSIKADDFDGVIFKVTLNGKLTVLHKFNNSDPSFGTDPLGGLRLGLDGAFYGTTPLFGTHGLGMIFRITASGNLTVIHNFAGGPEGAQPTSSLTLGPDGNFFGITGHDPELSFTMPVVYKVSPAGVLTPIGIVPFECDCFDRSVTLGTDGNLYGVYSDPTYFNNGYNRGIIFKMAPTGAQTNLHTFNSVPSPLFQGSDGNLYGTAGGGSYGGGELFRLTSEGNLSIVHNFPDPLITNDGAYPSIWLVQANDGNFYGSTAGGGTLGGGVFFRVSPEGDYTVLNNIDAGQLSEISSLMQHTNGKFYGTAVFGGSHGGGLVYSLDVGLPPFVRLVNPAGKVGTCIKILGQGFTGTTSVTFNGAPATFNVWSDTFLTANVPNGATTGYVTVTTPASTLKSDQEMRVRPVVVSVSSNGGATGTPVVITGTSLAETTKVAFGGGKSPASFTVVSDTQVTATVPAGASTGYIVLTTAGGKSRSPDLFTVVP